MDNFLAYGKYKVNLIFKILLVLTNFFDKSINFFDKFYNTMNLVIDIGNSRVKVALFEYYKIVHIFYYNEPSLFDLIHLISEYKINNIILSNTSEYNHKLVIGLKRLNINFLELKSDIRLPFKNQYQTPTTLGSDRIAAVAGAQFLFPNKNVLIFDAGTAITIDFIDSEGIYHGGNISPGIHMRFKALHHFTGKLPLVEQTDLISLLGSTTQMAINNGVIHGVIFEIENYIQQIHAQFSEIFAVLTGGDAQYLANKLKSPIFVEENLVLIGLNRILEYNVNE